jgi:hypothetical protein
MDIGHNTWTLAITHDIGHDTWTLAITHGQLSVDIRQDPDF